MLNWVLIIVVLLTLLLGLCVGAFAKPRAVADARIETQFDAQSTIRMPTPGAERIEAAPTEIEAMRVSPVDSTILVEHPLRPEISTALNRLLAQANGKSSRDVSLAAWQLGLISLHGAGVAVDRVQAQRWFEQAATPNTGVPVASAGLAWCAISGCAGPPDPEQAGEAIAALRASSPARADFLRWLLDQQTAPVTVAQPGKTEGGNLRNDERLLAAARNGDSQARVELGIRAASHKNFDEAMRWFRLAAHQSRAAKIDLDRVQLLANQKQSEAINPIAGGTGYAAFEKAQRYHRGLGGPANYAEAIRLYRQSAQQGYLPAKAMLELIFSRPGLNGTLNVAWMQQLAYVDTRQKLPQFAPATQPQLVRDPSPIFDFMSPFWQRQVQATGI